MSRKSATLRTFLAGVFGAFAAAQAGAADTLRCSGRFVEAGASMAEVESLCGEPDTKEVERVPIRGRGAQGAVVTLGVLKVEQWTYRRPGAFPVRLRFEETTLERIELLTDD